MSFKRYPKINRLGKEETDGILEGTCIVQEKVDGANASIWVDKRGEVVCGSRSRELTEGFNGLVDYVRKHEGIQAFFQDNPDKRMYGEWLVRHTVQYSETAYKQFYLFDITTKGDGEDAEPYMLQDEVESIAKDYGINYPQVFGVFENPTVEQLQEFVGKSELGEEGEGIVIKNLEHVDKWGNHCYAKMVTQKFLEANAVTFGGNNKHSDTYWEMYVVNKYLTLGRVEKAINKIQPMVDHRLDMQDIPRVANTVYHDMLTEEIWEISKKAHTINFKQLQRIATKKAIQIYKDLLTGDVSVADRQN